MKTLDEDFPPLGVVRNDGATNHYTALASINVNDKIEKKNGLSYLSWAWAVDQLLRADPSASWTYNDPVMFGQTLMVSCTVTAFGKPMTMQLPVMDYKNKAIANPDAFAVNTAMQRCLVKAIALHGLGLYIYAGEDLPLDEGSAEDKPVVKQYPASGAGVKEEAYDTLDDEGRAWVDALAQEVHAMHTDNKTPDEIITHIKWALGDSDQQWKLALWWKLPSNVRTFIDKQEKGIKAGDSPKAADKIKAAA